VIPCSLPRFAPCRRQQHVVRLGFVVLQSYEPGPYPVCSDASVHARWISCSRQSISDKLGFDEWLRVLDRQDIVGEWEVEQLSEITGDESTKGNIKIRLSIPTCKAAFMDSQNAEQLGVGQADSGSEQVRSERVVAPHARS